MSWQPLIDGELADRAVTTAREIAAAIDADPETTDPAKVGSGVASGSAGAALFYAYLADVTGDAAARDRANALVDATIEHVAELPGIDVRFYSGAVGAAWALAVLEGRLFDADEDENDVDEVVERALKVRPWPLDYELIRGVTGIGEYAVVRLPRPGARRSVEAAVALLGELAVEMPDGLAWHTDPRFAPLRAEQFPEGYYDFGLAHGLSGVVIFLAHALRAGVEEARPLLDGAVRRITANRLPDERRGRYPGIVGPDDPPEPTRVAWCYGDPGVAVALLAAGRALGDDAVVAEAAATALSCADRVEHSGVSDAGICHGSAGLAHVFNRLGQELGEERLLDLARYWLRYTLDHRLPDEPVAGFPAMFRPDLDAPPQWRAEAGILEGAAGVALTLLAATSDVEPYWDGMLLLRPVPAP